MTTREKKSPHALKHLGWILVFAVVYADIGTSIFYVPGILYLSIGNLATLAQIITTTVFVSIAFKYVEICERCPDGGGVVSICRLAFSKWTFLPLAGGALITVDYFLTAAISGVSGLYYLATLYAPAKAFVLPVSLALFVVLGILNVIGLRESATVISWFAGAKIIVSFLLLGTSLAWLAEHNAWAGIFASVIHPGVPLTMGTLMIGYADTWLAYSGLESAAQVSGVMEHPVRSTASKAMWLVVGTIAILSPPITAAALFILPESVKRGDPESLLSSLAFTTGGPIVGTLTVVAASTLLFMACNTAIVGNYHVNYRLADLGYLPAWLRKRHQRYGTPHLSILLSAAIPVAILVVTRGSVAALGDLYAFGLLGTLVLSSISIDKLRWRDGSRGLKFWSGVLTSVALVVAWVINMVHKPHALMFGGAIALFMVWTGMKRRRAAEREAATGFLKAESAAADTPEAEGILTIDEAIEASAMETSPVLISLRYANPKLLAAAAYHLKGAGARNAYVVFVDEAPGLYIPIESHPSDDARRNLVDSCAILAQHGITGIPIWRIAEDAGFAVADAATRLKVKHVFVGSSRRSFFWRMVRGRLLQKLAAQLPESCNLVIVG